MDNLLEALASHGVRVVRLGRPDSIRPELLQYCPDAAMGREGMSAQEKHDAKNAAVRGAQVVCATCIGAGTEVLARTH